MAPEAKQIYFFFILLPPEIGTALCCWISRMCPVTLTLAGWRAVNGSEIHPLSQPLSHSMHGRGREPSKQHGRGKRRPLIHTAVFCDKLHPVPCSTSLQQGRRLNSKTLSQFNLYLTNTQQAAGEKNQKFNPSQMTQFQRFLTNFLKLYPADFFRQCRYVWTI